MYIFVDSEYPTRVLAWEPAFKRHLFFFASIFRVDASWHATIVADNMVDVGGCVLACNNGCRQHGRYCDSHAQPHSSQQHRTVTAGITPRRRIDGEPRLERTKMESSVYTTNNLIFECCTSREDPMRDERRYAVNNLITHRTVGNRCSPYSLLVCTISFCGSHYCVDRIHNFYNVHGIKK